MIFLGTECDQAHYISPSLVTPQLYCKLSTLVVVIATSLVLYIPDFYSYLPPSIAQPTPNPRVAAKITNSWGLGRTPTERPTHFFFFLPGCYVWLLL